MNLKAVFFLVFSGLLGITVSPAQPKPAAVFYVSPSGSDRNPGTLTKPFRTVERAQAHVRKVSKSMTADIVVYLRQGQYPLKNTLVFGPEDSGTNGFKVVYRAYQSEKPVISGSRVITGWTAHEKGIYKAKVAGSPFRQLYLGNQRLTRARTPNAGKYNKIIFWDPKNQEIGLDQFDTGKWKNHDKIELIAQMQWAEAIMRLSSLQPNVASDSWVPGNFVRVKVQEPESRVVYKRVHPNRVNGQAYHFENAYEFIDEPGEWYLDQTAETLYLKPFADMPPEERIAVTAPVLDTLLSIKGMPDRPVHHLEFAGITFAHSNWTWPLHNGHIPIQASQYTQVSEDGRTSYGHPPAAVYLSFAHNIRFEGNQFSHLGATALDLRAGSSEVVIAGNVFQDIAGNGISVGKFMDGNALAGGFYKDPRELCKNNLIANNIITQTGMDYYGSVGVVCGYAEGTTIEHNEIYRTPYSGISVGWGWTKKENASRNNKIRFNHIHHVMQLMEDGAGIYTLSHQPGTEIYGNWIHDITPSAFIQRPIVRGIYLDEGSGGITIGNNAIEKGPIEEIGFHMVGEVIVNNNCCQGYNKDIRQQAGPQPEYRVLREFIY
jgi:hypothetical protein